MKVARLLAVAALLASLAVCAAAQEQKAPASPPGTAEITLSGKKITIDYSRPSTRGRKIFGGLVPYGQVWRTGANAATTLTTEANLNIGSANVPAGKYTLYTVPGEGGWKLIINKETGQWGTEYNEKDDLARVDMKVSKGASPTEQFTISFEKKTTASADLVLNWADTLATVSVVAK